MQLCIFLFSFSKEKKIQEIIYWQDQNSKSAIECDHLDLCWIVHCQALYMSALATDYYFDEMLEQIWFFLAFL